VGERLSITKLKVTGFRQGFVTVKDEHSISDVSCQEFFRLIEWCL